MAGHPAARSIAPRLMSTGIAVLDGFLGERRVDELIRCAADRQHRGDFSSARIGADDGLQLRQDIRGDDTCWLAAPLFEEERALLDDLEQLRLGLNREAYMGLVDLELHYARYAPGTGYARHVDQPQGHHQRKVSLVLYLNQHWTREAGGELRMFGREGEEPRDIDPIAGRLVCFMTEGREHAVMTSRRERLSISGWFRRRT